MRNSNVQRLTILDSIDTSDRGPDSWVLPNRAHSEFRFYHPGRPLLKRKRAFPFLEAQLEALDSFAEGD